MTLGDDDAKSISDPVQEDDSGVEADAAPRFIVASQVKVVDSQKADKAVGTFFGVQNTLLTHDVR